MGKNNLLNSTTGLTVAGGGVVGLLQSYYAMAITLLL